MVYHIAIIDYLQEWNFSKKVERFYKQIFLGKKGKLISAVEPCYYQERFVNTIIYQMLNSNQERLNFEQMSTEMDDVEINADDYVI